MVADGTTLSVRIEDLATHQVFTTSFTVNLAQVIGSDTAYAGFTAASGSSNYWELEDLLNWTFTSQVATPGAPTNLRQSGWVSSAIDLSWNSNSSNESGFQVERSLDGTNFTVIATTTATTYEDQGLLNATYYYRVRAFNSQGFSPYATTLTASPRWRGTPGTTPTSSRSISRS